MVDGMPMKAAMKLLAKASRRDSRGELPAAKLKTTQLKMQPPSQTKQAGTSSPRYLLS